MTIAALKFDDDKIEVRQDVPIRMHPDSLMNHIDTLNKDDTIGVAAISAAREALKICHEAYGRMNDAEAALRKASPSKARRRDGKMSDDDNVRMVNGTPTVHIDHEAFVTAAEQAFTRISPQVDRRVKELEGIKEILTKRVASAIDEPTRKTLEGLALASEVRSYVKNLSDKTRTTFVVDAIESNDKATVAAVLHAQPFLSGLTSEVHGMLRDRAAVKFAPVDAAQLGATIATIQHVNNAGSLLLGRYIKITALRNVPEADAAKKVRELAALR